MTTGAQRADAPQQDGLDQVHDTEWSVVPMSGDFTAEQWQSDEPQQLSATAKVFAAALLLLGLAWIAGAGWVLYRTNPQLTPALAVQWIPALCVPLILLGLVWQLYGRTSRRETERFRRSVAAMRTESAALESLLAIVATRLEENHSRLTTEASKLMSLGDEAADRLGRVAHYLAKESLELDRKSEALESAASAARVDLGVLLHDLPRAEEQARAVASAMREAGLDAHEQTGTLEGQVSALIARGREADEIVGGAAQRLAAHLARIESTATAASTRMDEASERLTAAVDAGMLHADEALQAARTGLDAQANATLAMLEHGSAAMNRVGEDSTQALAERLDTIGKHLENLAEHLAAQDAASHALVTGLSGELIELDQRFAQLAENGTNRTEALEGSVENVRSTVNQLMSDVTAGSERTSDLIGQAHGMAQALTAVVHQLDSDLPQALTRIEEQAGRTHSIAEAIGPQIDAIREVADTVAAQFGESEASIMRQREDLDRLIAGLTQGLTGAEMQLRALGAATEEADTAARRIVSDTSPELVEALLRVRETAQQAAERAREAISAVIPATAATLAEASREAINDAINASVNEQLTMLTELSERAVATARSASDRLTRQMLTIGKTAAAVEARIDESDREREEQDAQHLSRRVTLLMESLNSTAIDVTKILSNEVTDTAWTAYLKGDRGVFTRRAVKLLSSGEARAIAQHYEEEPEFRSQVNRYIHDFEAMLRRVLADRDGSSLGVTMLSSDIGKLYVALAQAIERFR